MAASFATHSANDGETPCSYHPSQPKGKQPHRPTSPGRVRSLSERSQSMAEPRSRRRGLKLAVVAGATGVATLLMTSGAAWATKSPPPDTSTAEGLGIATNILWVTI